MSDRIRLFNIPRYSDIDATQFDDLLYGPRVRAFEAEFSEYVGYRYGVACNSASSIIYLLCKHLFSQYRDVQIIVPTVCPVIVPNMIDNAGCRMNIAWVTLDWVGHVYTLFAPGEDSKEIVDSAHCVNANEGGRSYAAIYSFYPTKPVGGLDGGMLCSNDPYLVDHIRDMATGGAKRKGYKMYMNSVQAEWASRSLKKFATKKHRLMEINEKYNEAFGLQVMYSDHLYRVPTKRNDVETCVKYGKTVGIEIGHHYPRNRFGQSEAARAISIPYHDALSDADTDRVIEQVKPWME